MRRGPFLHNVTAEAAASTAEIAEVADQTAEIAEFAEQPFTFHRGDRRGAGRSSLSTAELASFAERPLHVPETARPSGGQATLKRSANSATFAALTRSKYLANSSENSATSAVVR